MINHIKKFRKEEGWTQEQLAEALDIGRTYLSDLENGKKTPSIKLSKKICLLLKRKYSDIFLY